MALVLLSIDRAAFMKLHTSGHDPEVSSTIVDLWEPYFSDLLECFLCGLETGFPPFSMILPEYDARFAASKLIVAPLCERCRDLKPPALRFSKCLTLLKKLHKARTGKSIVFQNIDHRQPHPR